MKIVKGAIVVCLIVVLASGLSVLTTAYVVNTYIQSVLTSFDIKLDSPAPGIGGFVKSLTGMGTKENSTSIADDSKNVEPAATQKSKDNTGSSTPSKDSDKAVEEKAPEDALAVMGEASNADEQSTSGLDQQLVMTPDDMGQLKDSLPADEKTNIFNILMTKLPQEEMQKISTAMEDGLTESEVKEIQEVISKYVNQDEYDLLMKMLTPGSGENLPK
jgi:hypothetical protein